MNITRSTTLRFIKLIVIGLVIFIIVGYAIWRSLNYFRGPEITIFEPVNGSSIATSTIVVRGQAERINNISLNGSLILIDEQGNFGRILAIFPGINILTFNASDQFGRTSSLELRLFGTVELPKSSSVKSTDKITSTSTP